jgi:hypothetical protein
MIKSSELQKLHKAAKQAPWGFPYWSRSTFYAGYDHVGGCMDEKSVKQGEANAALIVALRNAVPELIELLRAREGVKLDQD